MKKTVLCLALILVLTVHADYRCGDDWVAYEDEKCVRLFPNFATRDQAVETCNQHSSTLVIIGSAAEQMFLTEYIFNVSDSNNVWIGAKRRPDSTTNQFDWNDGSAVERFTNWEVGHPTSDVKRSCVQMHSQLSVQVSDMQWVDIACTVGNWFICQKLQSWPLEHFQQTLLGVRTDLEHYVGSLTSQLNDTAYQLDITKTELQRSVQNFTNQIADMANQLYLANSQLKFLQDNPIPIGFIYVQLSNQPEPKTLWPKVEWREITTDYAGLFFRAAGGGAAAFGSIQTEFSPTLTNVDRINRTWTNSFITVPPTGVPSAIVSTGDPGGMIHWGLAFTVSKGEVRPRNSATRIWVRNK